MKRDLIAYGTPFIDNLVHIDHLPTKKDERVRGMLQTSWQGGGKVSSGADRLRPARRRVPR